MVVNVWSATVPMQRVAAGLAAVRDENGVELGFPDTVLDEAESAVRAYVAPTRDLTDVEFVTLDPEGSTDLDQAFQIEEAGTGQVPRQVAFAARAGRVTQPPADVEQVHLVEGIECLDADQHLVTRHEATLSRNGRTPGAPQPYAQRRAPQVVMDKFLPIDLHSTGDHRI